MVDVIYNINIDQVFGVFDVVSWELYYDFVWKDYFFDVFEVQGVIDFVFDGIILCVLFKVLFKSQFVLGCEFNCCIKIVMDEVNIEIFLFQCSVSFGSVLLEVKLVCEVKQIQGVG